MVVMTSKDAAIAHLKKDIVFNQRSSSRKGEGNPRQRPKEVTKPEDVAAAGLVNHRLGFRLGPYTLDCRSPSTNSEPPTQTNGSTQHPPHRTDAPPSADFIEPPPLRASLEPLRSTTR
uniref:Uncharacterized protein n=1 Tax=Oryza rufipogon TaxID=4529 RepID=A0A0E0NYN4_ORYRU